MEGIDPQCERLLEGAGFLWDPTLRAWLNMKVRRAVAFDTVRANSVDWLEGWIAGTLGEPMK